MNGSEDRQRAHALVDEMPPDRLRAVRNLLESLLHADTKDPVLLSLLTAPPDDEPYTASQRDADENAEAAIARGEGLSHEEILRELGS